MDESSVYNVAIPILLLAIVWLQARLSRAAQPLRLELADCGEALLQMPDLPKAVRKLVAHDLDTAFGSRLTLLSGLLLIPAIGLCVIVAPKRFFADIGAFSVEQPELYKRYREFNDLHDKITMANNPILWFIFQLELLTVAYVAVLIFAALRSQMPNRALHDAITGLIETARPTKLFSSASAQA